MKMILSVAAAAVCACAACFADAKDSYVDPNPYAGYGPAMRSTAESAAASGLRSGVL